MKYKKKTWVIISLFIILVTIGLGIYLRIQPNAGKGEEALPSSRLDMDDFDREATAPVEVTTAKRDRLIMRISSTGRIDAIRKAIITAEVDGKLEKLLVSENKKVAKGELLAKIDDRQLLLALEEAEDDLLDSQLEYALMKSTESWADTAAKGSNRKLNIELNRAEKNWEKAQKLFQLGQISEKQLETAKTEYEVARILAGQERDRMIANKSGLTKAQIEVKRAELNLKHAQITAPFSGRIANLKTVEGEWVNAGTELFTLVDISKVKVEVDVLESEIGLVKEGRKAAVRLSAYPDKVFEGEVTTISPIVDPEKKTCRVTIILDNPEEKLKPGMFAQVRIESQIFEDRLILPKDAVLIRDQRKLVFVVKDGLAKWSYVETGLSNENYVEILKGVQEGDSVITSGHYTLTHDAPVRVVQGKTVGEKP